MTHSGRPSEDIDDERSRERPDDRSPADVIRAMLVDGADTDAEAPGLPVEIVIQPDAVDVRLLDRDGVHLASAYIERYDNQVRLVTSDEESGDDVADVIVLVADVGRALARPARPD